MEKRVFLIVLDSFGIGAEPDAAAFGDEGTNTLGAIAKHPNFNCPNLQKMGMFNIDGVTAGEKTAAPICSFARLPANIRHFHQNVRHFVHELTGRFFIFKRKCVIPWQRFLDRLKNSATAQSFPCPIVSQRI